MKRSDRFGFTALVVLFVLSPAAKANAALTDVHFVGQTGAALGGATVSLTAPDGKEQKKKTDDKGIVGFDLQPNVPYRFQMVDRRHLVLDEHRTVAAGDKGLAMSLAAPDGAHLRYPQKWDFSLSIGYLKESNDDIGFDRGTAVFSQPNFPSVEQEFDAEGDTTNLSLGAVYGELNHGLVRIGSGRSAWDLSARARVGSGKLTFEERSNDPTFPGVDFSGNGLYWSLGLLSRFDAGWPVDIVGGFEYRSLTGVGLDQSPDYFPGFSDGDGTYNDWRLHMGLAAPLGRFLELRHPCYRRVTLEAGAVATWSDASFSFTTHDPQFTDRSFRVTKDFSETSFRGSLGVGFPIYGNAMGHFGTEFGQGGWNFAFLVGYWGHSPFY